MKTLIAVIALLLFVLFAPARAADCVAVVYEDPADISGIQVRNVAWDDLEPLQSDLFYLRIAVQYVDDATGKTLVDNVGPAAQAGLDTVNPFGIQVTEQIPKEDDGEIPAKDRGYRATWRTVGPPSGRSALRDVLWGAHTAGSKVVLLHKYWGDPDYDTLIDLAAAADLGSCVP